MDPDDPGTWYKKPAQPAIMVQFFHHSALSATRNSPRIHKAFAEIWNTADLWPTIDRVSFNPPETDKWKFPGPRLHWDTSLDPPIPFGVQGILYLTDTLSTQGAFTCVPGFHRRVEEWVRGLPAYANPREQDLESLGAISIAASAGDLIIWHQALPHGSSPNRATRPRIAQYLSMNPAKWDYVKNWV